jgi:hypothetical protein
VNPVAVPPCPQVQALGRQALREKADLLAYQRPEPIVARGDQVLWPAAWYHEPAAHQLTPTTPGTAVGHIAVRSSQRYAFYLGGSFGRGFQVSIDGRHVADAKNELASFNGYVFLANVFLTAGVHTFTFTYPHGNLSPGSGDTEFTSLNAIVLEPQLPPSEMIEVAPARATRLCGRPLDWIELVTGAS